MAVSGWFVSLLAGGTVPVVLLGGWPGLLLWLALLVVLVTIDLIVAGSPRGLRFAREAPARVRLGESVAAELFVANGGRRTVHGILRDAWQPSAGARPT
ncbi:MAG: DUF58 domain-containing protein, partial [Pseudolysinimonas sp.]